MGQKPRVVFISALEDCDLSRASYAPSLSYLDLDDDSRCFYGTFDKVIYQSPLEIVKKVLAANGYVLNFENILASLDEFRLVPRVRLSEKGDAKAEQFLPAVKFKLPGKSSAGELLSSFYEELQNYAQEVRQLQAKPVKANKGSTEELERELDLHRRYTAELEERVQILAKELDGLRSSLNRMETQEGEVLPENTKRGQVKAVNLDERVVVVGFERSNLKVSMSLCQQEPQVGEACLVVLHDGQPTQLVLYESVNAPMSFLSARVLYLERETMKIRDSSRRTHVITAGTELEKARMAKLRRGDRLLIGLIQNVVVRFDRLLGLASDFFTATYQRQVISAQVAQENLMAAAEVMDEESKKEGAEKWRA